MTLSIKCKPCIKHSYNLKLRKLVSRKPHERRMHEKDIIFFPEHIEFGIPRPFSLAYMRVGSSNQ